MSNEKELDPRIYGGPHRPNWLWLGFLISTGLLLLLFIKQCNRPLPPAPDVVPVAVIRDSAREAQARHDRVVDSLNSTVRKYRTVADSGKAALAAIMARVRTLSSRADGSKLSYPNNLTSVTPRAGLPYGAKWTPPTNDYTGGDLQSIIVEQATLLQQQDSACTTTITALENIVIGKDGVIMAKDSLISALNGQLGIALSNQSALEAEARKLAKTARRAKRGRGFWRSVAVGLGAAVAYLKLAK